MKKDNLKYIVSVLAQNTEWVSAAEIAIQMHVTTRTVRNYISEINGLYLSKPIIASQKGYKWILDDKHSEDVQQTSCIAETPEQRLWFLIRKLIFNNTINSGKPLSIIGICNTLMISESVFFKDISDVRKFLFKYKILLHVKKNCLSIEGEETDLRHLLYDTICHYSTDSILFLSYINRTFPQYKIIEIENLIKRIFAHNQLNCDGYHINHLILYIVIQILRIFNNHLISSSEITIPNLSKLPEFLAVNEFSESIKQFINITYTWGEIDYLTILFLGFCQNNGKLPNVYSTTKNAINEYVTDLCKYENIYFYDDLLINRVTDFLEKLKIRCKYNLTVKNPLRASIRSNCSLIYDEAVWIVSHFKNKWKIKPNSDEISYLTMILCLYLKEKRKHSIIINATLICPEYYEIADFLKTNIEFHFSEQIKITDIVTDINLDQIKQNDMYISVVTLEKKKNYVNISPILSSRDYAAINYEIKSIEKSLNYKKFSMFLQSYSDTSLFELNHCFNSANEAIKYICSKLEEKNYVDSSFYDIICDREDTDSTAYFNFIAVPHAITNSVKRNAIYIILNQKTSDWGKRKVKLIILFAMTYDSMLDYKHLFRTIIHLFDDNANMHALLQANDYDSFVEIVYQLYQSSNH